MNTEYDEKFFADVKESGWTFDYVNQTHWVASQPVDIDDPDGAGYNAWVSGESLCVDSFGLHDSPTFVEVPLTVIKKLLELNG